MAGAIGGFASEVYEIQDASRKAAEEHGATPSADGDGGGGDGGDGGDGA